MRDVGAPRRDPEGGALRVGSPAPRTRGRRGCRRASSRGDVHAEELGGPVPAQPDLRRADRARVGVHDAGAHRAAGELGDERRAAVERRDDHARDRRRARSGTTPRSSGRGGARCGGCRPAGTRRTRAARASSPAEISESPPPITPASALPRSRSAMRRSSGESARSLPSSVTIFSPGRAVRTTISRPATLSRSKAWSGWPSSSSTKLVASTTFEMERTPHASSRRASQAGDGPIFDALDDARGVPRAAVGRLDPDLHRVRGAGRPAPRGAGPGARTRRAERRRDLAGDAEVRERVGPVRGDVHLEEHVLERRAPSRWACRASRRGRG